MRRSAFFVLVALVALSVGSAAYVRTLISYAGSVISVSWPESSTITYQYHSGVAAGPANVEAGSQPVVAIDAALQTIGGATGLSFVNGGNAGPASVGQDGMNTVTFANTAANQAAVGGALAIASYWFSVPSGAIFEADIVFNPAQSFSTLGSAGIFDIQAVATHEGGHAVGLDHSLMVNATMEPSSGAGSTNSRTLTRDDRAGLAGLYSAAALPGTGNIAGTIQRSGGQPVGGAHLIACDLLTGRTLVSGLSRNDGSYAVQNLDPGLYELWAQPLTNAYSPGNVGSSGWGSGSFDTNFATDVLGGIGSATTLVVKAGQTTSVPTFVVGGSATALHVRATFPMATATGGFGFGFGEPTIVDPGYSQWIGLVGPGFDSLPDSAFTIDSPFASLSGPSTQSGAVSVYGYKIFPLSVAADAPPGGYQIRVTDPATGETHVAPGYLEVNPAASPQAYALAYGPGCYAGGTVTLGAPTPPTLGNLAFTLEATGTAAGEAVVFVLSLAADELFIGPGCAVSVDLAQLIPPFDQSPVLATGSTTTLSIPLPMIPSLAGQDIYAQVAAVNAAMGGLRLSNGLALHLE